jgi:hypothetical protein
MRIRIIPDGDSCPQHDLGHGAAGPGRSTRLSGNQKQHHHELALLKRMVLDLCVSVCVRELRPPRFCKSSHAARHAASSSRWALSRHSQMIWPVRPDEFRMAFTSSSKLST